LRRNTPSKFFVPTDHPWKTDFFGKSTKPIALFMSKQVSLPKHKLDPAKRKLKKKLP